MRAHHTLVLTKHDPPAALVCTKRLQAGHHQMDPDTVVRLPREKSSRDLLSSTPSLSSSTSGSMARRSAPGMSTNINLDICIDRVWNEAMCCVSLPGTARHKAVHCLVFAWYCLDTRGLEATGQTEGWPQTARHMWKQMVICLLLACLVASHIPVSTKASYARPHPAVATWLSTYTKCHGHFRTGQRP